MNLFAVAVGAYRNTVCINNVGINNTCTISIKKILQIIKY